MSNILVPWKHCVFDSAEFDGGDSISLFHGVEIEKSEVDIRIYENNLVEIISVRFKEFLLELFEVDISWTIKPHVVEPFTTRDKVPGDIDLLIYNPKIPNISKAIEVK
ncbi:MAG: hypothetical protein KZQ87_16540, partial [Candidatus Thiodiazotropha sp. (ex Cardiolucina cf. quadrata)]|nr:hypothetical protein [Candidatus Thiodiazotropha sp. (ex Cardiolucina cf. quadrata)]